LFFAIENLDDKDSVVFKIYPTYQGPLDIINSGNYDHKGTVVIYPNHVSLRTSVQQGCFTFHPFPQGMEDYDPESMGMKADRIFIKPESKFQIKRELTYIGINYFTLFPDLDGLSKNIIWGSEMDYRYLE